MPTSKGGGNSHHSPDCKCFACGRQKEAIARAARGAAREGVGSHTAEAPQESLAPTALDGDILEVVPRTMRGRVAEWYAWRQKDPRLTNAEIAEKLGITPETLGTYIKKATREGWLRFTDPFSRLEHEIAPLVIDNLAYYLSKEGGRDKQVTIEAAKGFVFKQFLDTKGISEAPQTVLALKIETVAPDTPVKVSGHVVGTPRIIDSKPLEE